MGSERYLCHDEKQLAAAVARLEAEPQRQIMIVAGVVGSGRRYFLETVARRLSEAGKATRITTLSLEGFEPLAQGLSAFVEFGLGHGRHGSSTGDGGGVQEVPEELAGQFRKLLERVGQNAAAAGDGRWAVVLALLLAEAAPRAVAASNATAAFGAVAAAGTPTRALGDVLEALLEVQGQLTPEVAIAKVLAAWTADLAHLIVHIPAESTLSDTTLFWAMSRIFEQPRVCIAFSCAPQLTSEALTGGARIPCSGLRIELPMKPETAGARLKEINQSAGLGFEDAALDDIAKSSNGSIGRLARELEVAVAKKTAPQDEARLPARLRLERWFEELGDDAALVKRVLGWAAACGETVPVLPLLAAAQCSQADAERIIDRLDDDVCGPEAPLPMLDDLAYRHPGFPGLATYRFRDPALRSALLELATPEAQLESEGKLLEFLGARFGIGTRSTAQLFVNLAERVKFELSAGARQRLRLWVSPMEAGPLEQLMRADVAAGRLAADALFNTALRDQTLPPHQRLALLEASAAKEEELPLERRTMLTGLRTELLCGVGRFQDALVSAERGFELLGQQDPEPQGVRGLLLFLRANCERRLGKPEDALASFKAAAEQAKKPRPDGSLDYHNIGVCLAEAGHCHAEREQWAPAVELLREGIEALRQSPMEERIKNEQIAALQKNLAVCEQKLQAAAGG